MSVTVTLTLVGFPTTIPYTADLAGACRFDGARQLEDWISGGQAGTDLLKHHVGALR